MSESRTAVAERRVTARWPFFVVSVGLFVLLMGANLPTPLYLVYRQEFGFSSTMLTLIFAGYAIVLIPSLLVFGQLSDRIGRRRVMLPGLGAAALAMVLFAVAGNVVWLFAARAVQGVAVGATTAALVELEPGDDHARAALYATLGQAGGAAAGPILAGMLAQWLPAPRVLCYLVGLALTAVLAIAVWRTPEPHPPTGVWRLQRPRVPAEIRTAFARPALTGATVWSVAALFLSVVPSYAATVRHTHDLALLGALSALMLGTACAAQAVSLRARIRPATGQFAGLLLLVTGLAALIAAFPTHSPALLVAAAPLAGTGHGLGAVGSQIEINNLVPDERRGELTAAYVTGIYTGVSTAAIGVGALSDAMSCSPRSPSSPPSSPAPRSPPRCGTGPRPGTANHGDGGPGAPGAPPGAPAGHPEPVSRGRGRRTARRGRRVGRSRPGHPGWAPGGR
jgi:MFS family permease